MSQANHTWLWVTKVTSLGLGVRGGFLKLIKNYIMLRLLDQRKLLV